jgi:hypothetical protein
VFDSKEREHDTPQPPPIAFIARHRGLGDWAGRPRPLGEALRRNRQRFAIDAGRGKRDPRDVREEIHRAGIGGRDTCKDDEAALPLARGKTGQTIECPAHPRVGRGSSEVARLKNART